MSSRRKVAETLASMLPDAVSSEVMTLGCNGEENAFPEELSVIARAVPSRRREFLGGRCCARRALRKLGHDAVPIPQRPDRTPQWPVGIVGSLTHSEGCIAAAVARNDRIRSIGIDSEPNEPLPTGVRDLVLVDHEREMLEELEGERPDVQWDRLLFSAKESVYKAWYPLTGQWLDFTDCRITIQRGKGEFLAELHEHQPAHGIAEATGRWAIAGRHILTTLTVTD